MAKKVVATLRNTSGVKYAKLIRSKKSDKTGAYQFKEEIVIEDHVKDILAGKDPAELIEQMREKQDQQAPKEEPKAEDKPAEAPKQEPKSKYKKTISYFFIGLIIVFEGGCTFNPKQ